MRGDKTRAERIEEAARAVMEGSGRWMSDAEHHQLSIALAIPPDPSSGDARLRELRNELAAELKRVQRHPVGNRGLAWVIEKIDRLLAAPADDPRTAAGDSPQRKPDLMHQTAGETAGSTPASGATSDDEAVIAKISDAYTDAIDDNEEDKLLSDMEAVARRLAREKTDLRAEVEQALAWHKVASSERDELRAEVERLREESNDRLRRLRLVGQVLIKQIGSIGPENADDTAVRAAAKLAEADRRIAEMRAAAREFRFHEDITRFDCSDTPLETADDYNRLLAALKRIAEMGEAK